MKNNTGITIFGLLGVLFVALKLTGVIAWSWWFVTLPFYLTPLLIFIYFIWYLIKTVTLKTKKND